MPLFKKAKGLPDPEPVRVDVTWRDPVARRVRLAARSSDGETVRGLIDDAGDAHERELLVLAAVHGIARGSWIENLPEQHPTSATAWLVRGAHDIQSAWTARGGEHALLVPPEATAACAEWLERAEQDLREATALREDDPTAWALLVVSGYGLGLDFKVVCDRFDEADQRVPWLPLAHHRMLRATSPQWSGDLDTMFAFARDVADRAPEGSPCFDVIPLAHIEAWRQASAGDPALTMAAYLSTPDVAAEIDKAAARSVERADFDDRRQAVTARNTFAMALLEMGEVDRAREQIRRIGERVSVHPWIYQDPDPGLAFARAAQRAGHLLEV